MGIFTRDGINIPLPDMIQIPQPYAFLIYWLLFLNLLSFLLKKAKKAPNMKLAFNAALSIAIMYLACLLIYTFEPAGLQHYLAPLPFLELKEKTISLVIYSFTESGKFDFPALCSQILSMLVLAFLVNQIYQFKPGNLKVPGWIVFRFFSTVFCIGVHFALYKVLQKILSMIPSDSFIAILLPYLPIGLLCFILFIFILGWVKSMMNRFFEKINPAFEGLYGFFFSNKFGVNVTRAIYTTFLLTVFTYGLQMTFENIQQVATFSIYSLFGLGPIICFIVLIRFWITSGRKL